jgi:hypothetical protein
MDSHVASRSLLGRWQGLAIAAAIMAAGCGLRFAYINGQYTQPDEPIAPYVVARVLSSRDLDTNWAHTPIGTDFGAAQYNFSSYYITLSLLYRLRHAAPPHPSAGIEGQIVFFRGCSAAFGTLALALAMLLAFRIQGWKLALAAGLWIAASPLLVQDSHYARPEAFLTLMALGSVWLCGSRCLAPAWRSILAGLVFGFMVACKVTLLAWFWLPFVACFQEGGEWERCNWRTRVARAGLAASGIAGGFAAGAPGAITDPHGYLSGLRYLGHEYANTINYYSHDSGGMVYDFLWRYLTETAGWAVACFFALGLALAVARRQWRSLLVIFLPVVSLAAFLGARQAFFERNFSHAMPLYLLGAGLGLAALAEAAPLRRWSWLLFPAFAVAAALVPAELTGRMVFAGFTGRFEGRREVELERFLSSLNPPLAGEDHLVLAASDDDPWFHRNWEANPAPYVVLWQDINPEITRRCLQRMHARFDFEERAMLPGLFDDLRGPNTLRDYLGRTIRGLVLRGPRLPPPGGSDRDRANP